MVLAANDTELRDDNWCHLRLPSWVPGLVNMLIGLQICCVVIKAERMGRIERRMGGAEYTLPKATCSGMSRL
jgi:hypothetical protein